MEVEEGKVQQSDAASSSEIKNLVNILNHIESESRRVKQENEQNAQQKMKDMMTIVETLKTAMDNVSKSIISTLQDEMKNDETECNRICSSVAQHRNDLSKFKSMSNINDMNDDLKQEYTQLKRKIFVFQRDKKNSQMKSMQFSTTDNNNNNNSNNDNNTNKDISMSSSQKNDNNVNNDSGGIISNENEIKSIENNIISYLNNNFGTFKRANANNSNEYINNIDWKWDYCSKKDSKHKSIYENNNKLLKCNVSDKKYCDCFFRINTEMLPQTGVYKLKLLITKIGNKDSGGINIIGITATLDDKNNALPIGKPWWYSNDYIGWAHESGKKRNCEIVNGGGLYCSGKDDDATNNIFYKSKLKYVSNNEYYKYRLPSLYDNDIIILEYDSNNSILSFKKENKGENGEILDAYVKNLPPAKPFYWFVGHFAGKMTITILDE